MTPKQTKVAELLPLGDTNKEMAEKTGMTAVAVADHVDGLMKLFKAKNRTRLAVLLDRADEKRHVR